MVIAVHTAVVSATVPRTCTIWSGRYFTITGTFGCQLSGIHQKTGSDTTHHMGHSIPSQPGPPVQIIDFDEIKTLIQFMGPCKILFLYSK